MRSTLSRPRLRRPRSTSPTYVRWIPTSSASRSWDRPRAIRSWGSQAVPRPDPRSCGLLKQDARASFATRKRFPDVDELVVAWPHKYLEQVEIDQRTVLCVLTHDLKFEVPLLALALRSKAGYIGAMGSRRTHRDRLQRLREVGMTEQELSRMCAPIGLDLGARTPEETAVSIAAEIIARRWGGSGQSLTSMEAPIHRESLASIPSP